MDDSEVQMSSSALSLIPAIKSISQVTPEYRESVCENSEVFPSFTKHIKKLHDKNKVDNQEQNPKAGQPSLLQLAPSEMQSVPPNDLEKHSFINQESQRSDRDIIQASEPIVEVQPSMEVKEAPKPSEEKTKSDLRLFFEFLSFMPAETVGVDQETRKKYFESQKPFLVKCIRFIQAMIAIELVLWSITVATYLLFHRNGEQYDSFYNMVNLQTNTTAPTSLIEGDLLHLNETDKVANKTLELPGLNTTADNSTILTADKPEEQEEQTVPESSSELSTLDQVHQIQSVVSVVVPFFQLILSFIALRHYESKAKALPDFQDHSYHLCLVIGLSQGPLIPTSLMVSQAPRLHQSLDQLSLSFLCCRVLFQTFVVTLLLGQSKQTIKKCFREVSLCLGARYLLLILFKAQYNSFAEVVLLIQLLTTVVAVSVFGAGVSCYYLHNGLEKFQLLQEIESLNVEKNEYQKVIRMFPDSVMIIEEEELAKIEAISDDPSQNEIKTLFVNTGFQNILGRDDIKAYEVLTMQVFRPYLNTDTYFNQKQDEKVKQQDELLSLQQIILTRDKKKEGSMWFETGYNNQGDIFNNQNMSVVLEVSVASLNQFMGKQALLVCLRNTNTILRKQVLKLEDSWKHVMGEMVPQEQLKPLNTIISLTEVIKFRVQAFLNPFADDEDIDEEAIIALRETEMSQIFSFTLTVWSCAKLLSFIVQAQIERLKLQQGIYDHAIQSCVGGLHALFKDTVEPFQIQIKEKNLIIQYKIGKFPKEMKTDWKIARCIFHFQLLNSIEAAPKRATIQVIFQFEPSEESSMMGFLILQVVGQKQQSLNLAALKQLNNDQDAGFKTNMSAVDELAKSLGGSLQLFQNDETHVLTSRVPINMRPESVSRPGERKKEQETSHIDFGKIKRDIDRLRSILGDSADYQTKPLSPQNPMKRQNTIQGAQENMLLENMPNSRDTKDIKTCFTGIDNQDFITIDDKFWVQKHMFNQALYQQQHENKPGQTEMYFMNGVGMDESSAFSGDTIKNAYMKSMIPGPIEDDDLLDENDLKRNSNSDESVSCSVSIDGLMKKQQDNSASEESFTDSEGSESEQEGDSDSDSDFGSSSGDYEDLISERSQEQSVEPGDKEHGNEPSSLTLSLDNLDVDEADPYEYNKHSLAAKTLRYKDRKHSSKLKKTSLKVAQQQAESGLFNQSMDGHSPKGVNKPDPQAEQRRKMSIEPDGVVKNKPSDPSNNVVPNNQPDEPDLNAMPGDVGSQPPDYRANMNRRGLPSLRPIPEERKEGTSRNESSLHSNLVIEESKSGIVIRGGYQGGMKKQETGSDSQRSAQPSQFSHLSNSPIAARRQGLSSALNTKKQSSFNKQSRKKKVNKQSTFDQPSSSKHSKVTPPDSRQDSGINDDKLKKKIKEKTKVSVIQEEEKEVHGSADKNATPQSCLKNSGTRQKSPLRFGSLPKQVFFPKALMQQQQMERSPRKNQKKKKKCCEAEILLVDDKLFDFFDVDIINTDPALPKIKFDKAMSGIEAIELFKANIEKKCCSLYYKLVLMDLQMPNLDGFQAAELIFKLQSQMRFSVPDLPELVIVAMTAYTDDKVRSRLYNIGFKNFVLNKPIERAQMKYVLDVYFYKNKAVDKDFEDSQLDSMRDFISRHKHVVKQKPRPSIKEPGSVQKLVRSPKLQNFVNPLVPKK